MMIVIFLLLGFSGCAFNRAPKITTPNSVEQPAKPDGFRAFIPFLGDDGPAVELDYRWMSKWLFLAGIVALFFKHNWGAGCAFAGAILGPVVGRVADTFLAFSTYIAAAIACAVFVLAWQILKAKLDLDDDGNWFSDLWNKSRKKKAL